jgi:hypothetical protein
MALAIRKYMIKPVASTSVGFSGADRTAGSIPNRDAVSGISEPTLVDQVQIARIVSDTVNASGKVAVA